MAWSSRPNHSLLIKGLAGINLKWESESDNSWICRNFSVSHIKRFWSHLTRSVGSLIYSPFCWLQYNFVNRQKTAQKINETVPMKQLINYEWKGSQRHNIQRCWFRIPYHEDCLLCYYKITLPTACLRFVLSHPRAFWFSHRFSRRCESAQCHPSLSRKNIFPKRSVRCSSQFTASFRRWNTIFFSSRCVCFTF